MSLSHDLLEESTLKVGREIGRILNRLCDTDEKVGYMLVAVEFGTRHSAMATNIKREDILIILEEIERHQRWAV